MKTLIIAEAGLNHNGDIALARELVARAAEAGADVVKFQSFITSKAISRNAPKAEYQKAQGDVGETQFEMVRKLELSRAEHELLLSECRKCGIEFFSTAFDAESLDMLMQLGLERIKIPSGEITNLPFLRRVASQGKAVILSTGMANLGEVECALNVLEEGGTPRRRITVLHCNTEYPTPMRDVNLRAMCNLRSAFGVEVGYSDHTMGIEVPVAAVALGARIIEKHFTLDRTLPGPDHKASLEPAEMKAMVQAIRNIESALGDGVKRPSLSESKNIPIARKSVVAARAIRAGERFSEDNITTKRPGNGLSPMRWDEVIGRTAARDFAPDDVIEL
jgi:N-acetylneuraminate synthase